MNVNSTASGGGVAELLQTLLAYVRGVGVDARWVVIEGDRGVLRGDQADPQPSLRIARRRRTARARAAPRVRGDAPAQRRRAAVVHPRRRHRDPARPADGRARGRGARRGRARRVAMSRRPRRRRTTPPTLGWEFLRPYLEPVDAFVFTRAEFAPDWVDRDRLHVITPSIDPFCAKNAQLDTGRDPGDPAVRRTARWRRQCGARHVPPARRLTRSRSTGGSTSCRPARRPRPGRPLVVQLSRWDRIKDMQGVLEAFAEYVDRSFGAHLMLVGPRGVRRHRRPRGRRRARRLRRRRGASSRGRRGRVFTSRASR